jgi:predicted metal-dependent hydrolase
MSEKLTLHFDGVLLPYTLERSSRSKRLRIVADIEVGIRLIAPERVSLRECERFMYSQKEWILVQWERMQKQRVKQAKLFQPFLEKNSVVYLGKEYQLVVDVGVRHWPPVSVEDDVLIVHCVKADLAEKILERWYRQQAKAVIAGALEKYRALMGVKYNELTIKDQKTRWGSCSSKGNLNFSWRLILAPKSVLDYVVVHELAHLREMNHSARFWSVVEKFFPEYKKQIKWLKDNGVGLRI